MKITHYAKSIALAVALIATTSVFSQTVTTTVVSGGSGGGGAQIDCCLNIAGIQTTVPEGFTANTDGTCTPKNSAEMTAQINALVGMIAHLQKQLEATRSGTTVTISDEGQPTDQMVRVGALASYTEIELSMTKAEFSQSVYLTVQKRGFLRDANPDLYLAIGDKAISWGPFKLNERDQALVGPIHVSPDRPVRVTLYAKVGSISANQATVIPNMALDITGISVDGYTTVRKTVSFSGQFPILGATHTFDLSTPVATLSFGSSDKIAAQNIVKNQGMQMLGGFKSTAKGEAVSHNLLGFYVDGGKADISPTTSIVLMDENGNIVAGPVDVSVGEKSEGGYFFFRDTVVFPEGSHDYFLKGKVGRTFTGSAIRVSLPNTQSQPARGLTTGNLIFPIETSGWGPTMTVKGPSKIKVSVHNEVASRYAIAGSMGVEGLELVVDSTQANGPVGIRVFGGLGLGTIGFKATDTHNVMLYDGTTAVNNGSNALNPSSNGIQQITPQGLFIIQPGVTKSLKLKQNVSVTVTGSMSWSLLAGGIKAVDMVTGEEAEIEVVPSQGPLIKVVRSGDISLKVTSPFQTTAKANTIAKIASFDVTASIEGVQDGFMTLSVESVDSEIDLIGYQTRLVINGSFIDGVVFPQDSYLVTVSFPLRGVSIPADTTVRADVYVEILNMPKGSALRTWKESPVYMTGQTSGVHIPMKSRTDMLGHVVMQK